MRRFFQALVSVAILLTAAVTSAGAQKPEFSADMQILNTNGQTQTVKLFVGNKRARLDRSEPGNQPNGIGSLLIDFENQLVFLLIPQSKLYLQIAGSLGMPFYRGAWLFRPDSPDRPCSGWVTEADRRGISLRCQPAGQDTVDGRTTEKWDGTTSEGGHGSIWYDPKLNFIVKVLRVSKTGTQSGYELHNIKEATQPPALFEIPGDYREFALTRLLDALTGFAQW
jgi:hypothetical protein